MGAVGTPVEVGVALPGDAESSLLSRRPEPARRRKKTRLHSLTKPLPRRPLRSQLERACRIALMETEQPASVESIYDRIVRRDSLQFFGYKRPFQVIASAMSTLVKRGEAIALIQKSARSRGAWRQRLWRRVTPDALPRRVASTSQ